MSYNYDTSSLGFVRVCPPDGFKVLSMNSPAALALARSAKQKQKKCSACPKRRGPRSLCGGRAPNFIQMGR